MSRSVLLAMCYLPPMLDELLHCILQLAKVAIVGYIGFWVLLVIIGVFSS